MKNNTFIISITIILMLFSGCKKYEEGPCISFRDVHKRLEGRWMVDKYYIDNSDNSKNYKDNFACGIKLNLKEPGDIIGNYYSLIDCSIDSVQYNAGFWELLGDENNKYAKLSFTILYQSLDSLSHGIGVFNTDTMTTWNIMKLSNKFLNLETELRGIKYRVELNKN